jgi:hypothetical protein
MPDTFPEDAVTKLASEVHDPYFFAHLKQAWNIEPRSQHDADRLLEIARDLREADDLEHQKVASASNSFLDDAYLSLRSALGSYGYQPAPDNHDAAIKQAAVAMTGDPELAQAALEYAQFLSADA